MTDREALLRAVLLDPADDLPRLVFADWLEENGEPERAAFIRDAVELERLGLPDGPCPLACPCGGVGDRLAETVSVRGDEWSPPFPDEKPGDLFFVWRRGFPTEVTCTFAAFFAHAPALFAAHPVTRFTISDAVIHPSGGNDTYFVGGLGQFPSEYWRRLEGHRTRWTALTALSAACVAYGRQLADLPPLRTPAGATR